MFYQMHCQVVISQNHVDLRNPHANQPFLIEKVRLAFYNEVRWKFLATFASLAICFTSCQTPIFPTTQSSHRLIWSLHNAPTTKSQREHCLHRSWKCFWTQWNLSLQWDDRMRHPRWEIGNVMNQNTQFLADQVAKSAKHHQEVLNCKMKSICKTFLTIQ